MQTLGWIVVALAATMLVAALRASAEHVVGAMLGLPARLLDAGETGAAAAAGYVRGLGTRARDALAYGGAGSAPTPAAWDIVSPLVYLVLLVLLAAGDLVLAGLRFGALLSIPVDSSLVQGTSLDLLAGLLFLAILATLGCALLDVLHITPLRRPYGLVEGRARSVVMGAAAAGTALSTLSAVLFFVWGQEAIAGNPSGDAATLFIAIFAITLVTASIFAAGGALGAVTASWVLVCGLAAALLAVVAWLFHLLGVLAEGVHHLAVAVLRLLARPGTIIWNWMASLGAARLLRLSPIPAPEPIVDLVAMTPRDLMALARAAS